MTIAPIKTKSFIGGDRSTSDMTIAKPVVVNAVANASASGAIPTKQILRNPVTALGFDEQIDTMVQWAAKRQSKAVCVANVHMIMEAYWRPEFAAVLRKAELVTPDGMPLVWMLRQLGSTSQDRVAGMDIFRALCQRSPQCNLKLFFVGSTPEILEAMRSRLQQEYPNLDVVGMEPLPFRPLTEQEDQELVAKIEASQANLVMVSLGCPKQEYWIAQHKDKINAVMIGLGAVFPVYAGVHKHAPKWVQKSGLEWSYRLMQEPRRLFGRYSSTIPPFIWLAAKQLFTELFGDRQVTQGTNSQYNYLPTLKDLGEQIINPAPIGEILVKQKAITAAQLNLALQQQRKSGQKLGEVLLNNQFLSEVELHRSLENQYIKLGQLLVRKNVISPSSLEQLLQEQKQSNYRLGEYLVEQSILSPAQLENTLLEQCWRRKGVWMIA
jgi:N-acetylglucosaminyldiphosphoundecaprenol N-acetyl-beta-D-mannosaminyltransferase